MKDKNMRGRLDFKIEVISSDDEKGILEVRLTPDPLRYNWEMVKGERFLYDKLDHVRIPMSVLKDAMKKSDPLPIYFQPPLLENVEEYIIKRIPHIKEELIGEFPKPTFEDKSEDFLESLKKDELGFVILSLDMVNSTKISTELPPDKFAKLISVLLYEISNVIPLFHGHILKYTGDGIIAYFPEPSFVSKNDLALDCSLTLIKMIYNGLNPILESHDFPKIEIRIGLDSGDAIVVTMGSPATKQHKDIIGSVVSLACKIQSTAEPGSINLGEATYQNLYIEWKSLCHKINLPEGWKYESSEGIPYKIFTFTGKEHK